MLSPEVLEYRDRIFRKLNIKSYYDFRILNFGCGQGHDNVDFADKSMFVVGIDIVPSARWSGFRSQNSNFILSDGCYLPCKDNSFDIIFVKDVLHHIDKHDLALREILRVVKPNGTIYILESNRYNPISYFHMTVAENHQHFTKTYFRKVTSLQSLGHDVAFDSFEAHVIPLKSGLLRELFYLVEDLMERTFVINKFLSYNLAIIKKSA